MPEGDATMVMHGAVHDIYDDGGLLKTTLRAGDASSGTPPALSRCKVRYIGAVLQDTKLADVADGEERRWMHRGAFESLTVWKHDEEPQLDEPIFKCMRVAGIADVLHADHGEDAKKGTNSAQPNALTLTSDGPEARALPAPPLRFPRQMSRVERHHRAWLRPARPRTRPVALECSTTT